MSNNPTFAEKNRNPGTPKRCNDCGITFTSYMPLNVMQRPQRCKECALLYDREKSRRYRARVQADPARHETHLEYRRIYQGTPTVPLLENWPYGYKDWPIPIINSIIPKYIPEHIRSDIAQELCTQLILGDIHENDLPYVYQQAARKAYGPHCKSLDAPIGEGFTLAGFLSDPSAEEAFERIERD